MRNCTDTLGLINQRFVEPIKPIEIYKSGFVGLSGEYIEGIFVSGKMQSQGIGKLLVNYIKDRKAELRLNVYQKNTRTIHFYQREGFEIQCEDFDDVTGEKEYVMIWQQNSKYAEDSLC